MPGITFSQIPLQVNTPGLYAEFDSSRASRGLAALPHVTLIVAQKLASGTATAGVPVLCETKEQAIAFAGLRSIAAQMVAAYKANDPLTELWLLPLADVGGGTAATGSFTWTGTATVAGELPFYIGGRRIPVAVTVGMTAAQLETAALAAAALNADLPVALAGNTGTGLDLTAHHTGTVGNGIRLGVALAPGESVPAGFTVTVTQMSGGASDPDHTDAVTGMGEDQYHTIATGCSASTEVAKLITELESRWQAMRAIDGHLFFARADTRGNLTTSGNGYNSPVASLVGYEQSAFTPLPWEVAARAAAIDARQSQSDPALARTGLLLGGNAAQRGARFTRGDRDILLTDGVSTVLAASDGRMAIERLVTTYQTNGLSIPDTAYMDIMTVRVLSALRYTLRAWIGTKFARTKLMNDPVGNEVLPDNTVTPSIVRNEILAWYRTCMEARGWVENFKAFEEQLVVERDSSDPNRLNMFVPPDLINNFLVGAIKIAFAR